MNLLPWRLRLLQQQMKNRVISCLMVIILIFFLTYLIQDYVVRVRITTQTHQHLTSFLLQSIHQRLAEQRQLLADIKVVSSKRCDTARHRIRVKQIAFFFDD